MMSRDVIMVDSGVMLTAFGRLSEQPAAGLKAGCRSMLSVSPMAVFRALQ